MNCHTRCSWKLHMSFRGQNEKYCLKTDTTGENKAVREPRRRKDSQSEGTIWERKLVKIDEDLNSQDSTTIDVIQIYKLLRSMRDRPQLLRGGEGTMQMKGPIFRLAVGFFCIWSFGHSAAEIHSRMSSSCWSLWSPIVPCARDQLLHEGSV